MGGRHIHTLGPPTRATFSLKPLLENDPTIHSLLKYLVPLAAAEGKDAPKPERKCSSRVFFHHRSVQRDVQELVHTLSLLELLWWLKTSGQKDAPSVVVVVVVIVVVVVVVVVVTIIMYD